MFMGMDKNKIQSWQLKQRQAMPLWMKEEYTKNRIIQWYEYWNGNVYVSFSGGKDSTVLLHQVRKLYPEVSAVFSDTGLEYPEIRKFVKTIDNVIWVRPKIGFKDVLTKYGYPVGSKEISHKIYQIRHTKSDMLRNKRLYGDCNGNGKVSEKWKILIKAPFEVHDECCSVLKKNPINIYERISGLKPYVGTMASDSTLRKTNYLKHGCNAYNGRQASTPMAFWLESDIWDYIHKYNLPYSKIYDLGYSRTGCMFCMFGIHLEKEPNRFQLMKITHPKQYDYCMNVLGISKVLEYIGVKYE